MNPFCLNPGGVLQTLIFNPFQPLSVVYTLLLPFALFAMIPLSIYYSVQACMQ